MILLLLVAGVAKLVFVLYKHLGQFLSTENATLRGMGDLNKRNLSLTVNSHILSASITKESSRVFVADPVIFTLEHLDVRLPQTTLYRWAVKILKRLHSLLQWRDKRSALIYYCCRKTVGVKRNHLYYVSVSYEMISTNQKCGLVELEPVRLLLCRISPCALKIAIVTLLASQHIKILFSSIYLDIIRHFSYHNPLHLKHFNCADIISKTNTHTSTHQVHWHPVSYS